MTEGEDWPELGRRVTARLAAKQYSTHKAERAGGPSAPSWGRIAKGQRVTAPILYQMCRTLEVDEGTAREWFSLVSYDFDSAGLERPGAVDALISSLEDAKRGIDGALAAALRLEAEGRGQQ